MLNDCKCHASDKDYIQKEAIVIKSKQVHYKIDKSKLKNEGKTIIFYFHISIWNGEEGEYFHDCYLNCCTKEEIKYKFGNYNNIKSICTFTDIDADLFCFDCKKLFMTKDQFSDLEKLSSIGFNAGKKYLESLFNNKETLHAMQVRGEYLANSDGYEDW